MKQNRCVSGLVLRIQLGPSMHAASDPLCLLLNEHRNKKCPRNRFACPSSHPIARRISLQQNKGRKRGRTRKTVRRGRKETPNRRQKKQRARISSPQRLQASSRFGRSQSHHGPASRQNRSETNKPRQKDNIAPQTPQRRHHMRASKPNNNKTLLYMYLNSDFCFGLKIPIYIALNS